MRVGFLLRSSQSSLRYLNRVHDEFGVDFIVVERDGRWVTRLKRKYRQNTLGDTLGLGLSLAWRILKSMLLKKSETEVESFPQDVPLIEVDHINCQKTVLLLEERTPDVLLIRGTSIVKHEVLGLAKRSLNVHAGLSPYYRGTHCTGWALLNWDPYNVGSTLHYATRELDGGEIVSQRRVEIQPDDTVEKIEDRMADLSIDQALAAMRLLGQGKQLKTHSQNIAEGYLTLEKQWSIHCERQIRYIEKAGVLAKMLRSPSRPALPIIDGPEPAPEAGTVAGREE